MVCPSPLQIRVLSKEYKKRQRLLQIRSIGHMELRC